MMYSPDDIDAAQWTLTYGEARTRASASEYLDNILSGQIRRMVMPIVDDLPEEERVRRANVLIKSRRRDAEERHHARAPRIHHPAEQWAEKGRHQEAEREHARRDAALESLEFPQKPFRPGQRDMAAGVTV